jgi:outer membrane protein assembly factor BamB
MILQLLVSLGFLLTAAQSGENWPGFRGPTGQGLSADPAPPLEWSAESNVLWKTPIPGEGWSSPIVWNDRVFVTAALEGGTKCHVLALDRAGGRILWDTPVFDQAAVRKEGKNSYATPTPCTDGERVYAVFGEGGAAALDFDGKVLWTNRDVQFYSRHGLGASPLLHGGLLIMPYDGSNRVPAAGQWPKNSDEERLGWQIPWDRSEIVALDAKTGKRAWTAKRGMSRIAHATPILIEEGGRERLLSIAGDVVQSFDPKTGERFWSAYCQGEGLVPTPVAGEGLVFAASGFEKTTLRAIRSGGTGDVTATHIVWEQKKGVPTQPSLLYLSPHLYAVTEGGVASCFKAATGEIVWQERIADKQGFSASPVSAAGRIYILSETGETTVIAAGPEFKVLARNALKEKCQASPAISRGNLFLRSDKHLYCIGQAR